MSYRILIVLLLFEQRVITKNKWLLVLCFPPLKTVRLCNLGERNQIKPFQATEIFFCSQSYLAVMSLEHSDLGCSPLGGSFLGNGDCTAPALEQALCWVHYASSLWSSGVSAEPTASQSPSLPARGKRPLGHSFPVETVLGYCLWEERTIRSPSTFASYVLIFSC